MVTGNQSSNVCGTEYIDSRCIVEFRPDDNWEGEYGFDWFRIGDCKEPKRNGLSDDKIINPAKDGSSHYVTHKIVGKYIAMDASGNWQYMINGTPPDPDHPNFRGDFTTDTVSKRYYWADKLVTHEYKFFCILGSDRNYITPWITLFFSSVKKYKGRIELPKEMTFKDANGTYHRKPIYKSIVTVKLIINARNIDRIEFESTPQVSISPKRIYGINNGKNTQHKLTISYNYKFDESYQSIKAYAVHNDGITRTFAGQINVERCIPKVVDVCFVNVLTKRGDNYSRGGLPDFNAIDAQIDNLSKYLAQAHIIPNIKYRELKISWDDRGKNYHNNTYTSRTRGEVFLVFGKTEQGAIRNNKGLLRYKELGDKLEKIFNDKEENRHEINAYKIFFLDRPIFIDTADAENQLVGGIAGKATEITSRSAIIAKVPQNPSTVCHELLHCFGLYHSFSNEGDFTYKKCMTSNIMDYSFVGEKYNCLRSISLWLWQWRKIRQNNDLKDIDIENDLVRVT